MAIDPNLPDHNRNTLEQEKFRYKDSGVVVATTTVQAAGESTTISTPSTLSINNSTSTALGIDETFIGQWEDVLNFSNISIVIFTDEPSITDGLKLEFSSDGVNVDESDSYSLFAGSGKQFTLGVIAKYFRINYTNDGIAQTAFRLQTIFHQSRPKPSSHRIDDAIVGQDDAELTKSVLTAVNDGGTFVNIKASSSDNLKITDAESGLAIAKGDVLNTGIVHKFGDAPDFDVSDGFVNVWDGADDSIVAGAMQYTYSTTADIDRISSSDATDVQDVELQGLDADYNLVVQTLTLIGQTPVSLSTPLIRIFRMKNVGSIDFIGLVSCYTSDATVTAGIPSPTTTIRAMMKAGNNQTLMALYTVPAGKTAYMRNLFSSVSGAKRSSSHIVKLFARKLNGVFQIKYKSAINDTGSSFLSHYYIDPAKFTEKTDIQLLVNTDQDVAGVSGGFDMVLIDN